MERRFYGLTIIDIRHIAYEIAEKLNMNHYFSKSTTMAWVDWLQGFLSRNHNLSIRVPTATNISNVQKPGKIIATRGSRTVVKMPSGELGQNVTIICGMNAAGQYIPVCKKKDG